VAAVGIIPALALIAGALCATEIDASFGTLRWLLPAVCVAAAASWRSRREAFTAILLFAGFAVAGAVLTGHARSRALHPSLRAVLDRELGGFTVEAIGPEGDHDPLPMRATLTEDAAPRGDYVSLRAGVVAVAVRGRWESAEGGVLLTVNGALAARLVPHWRAGRTIEAAVAFRRPERYLNDGVPDFERDLALDGTTLLASTKSGLLVRILAHGSAVEELAADIRAHVRRATSRWIAPHSEVAGAVVNAVLIGDRTGLPDEIRERLQAAGTYHVIAISGGNIAILAALVLGMLMLFALPGRVVASVTILTLVAYSQIATAGPSVWRATFMAVLYLSARLLDHRTAPWQATSIAAAVMLVVRPLDIRDPGFILTFGATGALLEGARRGRALLPANRALAWVLASVIASLAVECALLPISAWLFSRLTVAGVVLNLIAVPAMGIAQIAGIVVAVFDSCASVARGAGWIAHIAATVLVESARLVDAAPFLTRRVPPPPLLLVVAYYGVVAIALYGPRRAALRDPALALVICLLVVAALIAVGSARRERGVGLRWTIFDVGQGEAMLIESADRALQVDAGGAPFGAGLDIGPRVLAPALWARGVRGLDALLVTHGDPDHIGGARMLIADFSPPQYWEGIEVPRHGPSRTLRDAAAEARIAPRRLRAGQRFDWGRALVRVLHPPEPDWERPRVRNDDSVVLEIVYGDVALLLSGDISAEIERSIAALLTPAAVRILKVAHHGSRTSTSRELLDAWRPHIAVISAGRGNTFGHPAPQVLQRLESIGARVYRTDLHGQITVETDGRDVRVTTFVGGSDAGR
jgi:competence protein ComEC